MGDCKSIDDCVRNLAQTFADRYDLIDYSTADYRNKGITLRFALRFNPFVTQKFFKYGGAEGRLSDGYLMVHGFLNDVRGILEMIK